MKNTEKLTIIELKNWLDELIDKGYGDLVYEVESKPVGVSIPKTPSRIPKPIETLKEDEDEDEDEDYLSIIPSPLAINKKDNLFRGHRWGILGLW